MCCTFYNIPIALISACPAHSCVGVVHALHHPYLLPPVYSPSLLQLLETNSLTDKVTVIEKPCLQLTAGDFGGREIDAIIGEPFFSSSLLSWHNIHYWYAVSAMKKFMSPECVVLPNRASLMAIAGERKREGEGRREGGGGGGVEHAVQHFLGNLLLK